eukprot:m.61311 g.61311  ORF g.61311 m.61311 type:complete len:652 (-) comp22966_c0_seq2:51-2006(-)
MSDPERKIRILLVGDRAVGKTCLIKSLITSQVELNANVPPRFTEIQVPFDMMEHGTTTVIVDTSLRTQSEDEIAEEVAKASVICIVYAADIGEKSVKDFWLPFIREHTTSQDGPSKTPVILIRNKTDLAETHDKPDKPNLGGEVTNHLLQECTPIMQVFREVVTCVGCSATNMSLVAEAFHYALNAVLFPMGPLYDLERRCLVDDAVTAIQRIFRICDRSCDDLLDNEELNKFQIACFSGSDPLAIKELESVKLLIKENVADGVVEDKVTLSGFLFLNRLFIERGRPETTWAVLRHFGYSDSLELKEPRHDKVSSMSSDQSTELTDAAELFLTERFIACAKEAKSLSKDNLLKLFQAAPASWANQYLKHLYDDCGSELPDTMNVSQDTFLSVWRTMVLVDCKCALMLLAYLGFGIGKDGSSREVSEAIHVTQRRLLDWKANMTLRTSFMCFMIGSKQCKDIVNTQVAHSRGGFHTTQLTTRVGSTDISACSTGKNHLVFASIDSENAEDVQHADMFIDECDTLLLLFDECDPESFATMSKLYCADKFSAAQTIVVGINTASDKTTATQVQQNCATPPEKFCWDRGLRVPLRNIKSEDLDQVLLAVETTAKAPSSPWSNGYSGGGSGWMLASAAAAAIVGILVYRHYSSTSR